MLTTTILAQAAQTSSQSAATTAAALARSRDSLELLRQHMALDSIYRELLERTNTQLALGWTPWSTFLAALGVLFSVGAIFAGYIIWRQSKDYRDAVAATIRNHESLLEGTRLETERRLSVILSGVDKEIDAKRRTLDALTGHARDLLELEVRGLEQVKRIAELITTAIPDKTTQAAGAAGPSHKRTLDSTPRARPPRALDEAKEDAPK